MMTVIYLIWELLIILLDKNSFPKIFIFKASLKSSKIIGRQFDKNGERKNWWTKASLNAFHERSGCMAEQYSMYSMYDINVS